MSTILIVVFGTLFALLAAAVPVGVALGAAALIGMYFGDIDFTMLVQRLFNTFDAFPLLAVPFFVLAGDIMQQGTIANTLLKFCRTLTGHLTGDSIMFLSLPVFFMVHFPVPLLQQQQLLAVS